MVKRIIVILVFLIPGSLYAASLDQGSLLITEARTVLLQVSAITNMYAESPDIKLLEISIADTGNAIPSEILHAVDLATLYGEMESPIDRIKVRNTFYEEKSTILNLCSVDNDYLTKTLDSTLKPALYYEGEKLKDDILKSCNIVQNWDLDK